MSIEDACQYDCTEHTGEAYLVRITGLGTHACFVLCQTARDVERANGHKVESVEPSPTGCEAHEEKRGT